MGARGHIAGAWPLMAHWAGALGESCFTEADPRMIAAGGECADAETAFALIGTPLAGLPAGPDGRIVYPVRTNVIRGRVPG